MSTVVAGIDVSKNQLDAHVAGEGRRVANQRDGYRALGAWLEQHGATRVVLEATGRYHRAVHQSLHARGLEVVLVNPLRSRRFAEALGLLAKTDTIDAAALAAYGTACLDLPATPPRSAFMEQLADLLVLEARTHRVCPGVAPSGGDGRCRIPRVAGGSLAERRPRSARQVATF